MSNPFNPQWYGFSAASDKQLSGGSAPFVYNYLSHDSQTCIAAKSVFNTTHVEMYRPDSIVRSHPASSVIQSSLMKMHESVIKDVCHPSFSIDTNIINIPSGMPAPSFS
jgi:hypothetical protein